MKKTIGEIIREARLARGLSQSELAKLTNISAVQISLIETNKTKHPHLSTLVLLAKPLNLDLKSLKSTFGYSSTAPADTLGKLIKQARIQANLSQQDLSNLSGISIAYISLLENDKIKSPYLPYLTIFVKILNLNLETLKKRIC